MKVVRDLFIQNILMLAQILGNVDIIEFTPDGSYILCSSLQSEKKRVYIEKKKLNYDIINID